jgi:hypothetical protein
MRLSRFVPVVIAFCLSVGVASAGNFSFTGTFTHDDQLQIFLFTAPSASTMVRTWGYAGGTNANGQIVAEGGFDPILSVFDATGGLVAISPLLNANDNGVPCAPNPPASTCVSADSVTGSEFDSLIALSALNPGGIYALVLSEADNTAVGPNFGAGFTQAGQGNFTASEFPCGGPAFCDANLAQRTGNWAVDITGVGSATEPGTGVPEPASMLLLATGITSLALFRRRRNSI